MEDLADKKFNLLLFKLPVFVLVVLIEDDTKKFPREGTKSAHIVFGRLWRSSQYLLALADPPLDKAEVLHVSHESVGSLDLFLKDGVDIGWIHLDSEKTVGVVEELGELLGGELPLRGVLDATFLLVATLQGQFAAMTLQQEIGLY